MYVFDTSSLRHLAGFFPDRFPSLWKQVDELIAQGKIVSTREVLNEAEKRPDLKDWLQKNKDIFHNPTAEEGNFIREIFEVKHFQQSMSNQQRYRGGNFADPWVIAKAKIFEGTVVTEEKFKKGGTQVPVICKHFNIDCINLEKLMEREDWKF